MHDFCDTQVKQIWLASLIYVFECVQLYLILIVLLDMSDISEEGSV